MILKLPLADPIPALQVFFTPVAYLEQPSVWREIDTIIDNIENNQGFLSTLPRKSLVGSVYMMLMMAAVSLKHPGFHEEREWRLIHSPIQFPSLHVLPSTEIVGGIPQVVHKIILENKPNAGIKGIEIPEVLDRVIIGPSQYAISIYMSLLKELTAAGVTNAADKVKISGIPLRT